MSISLNFESIQEIPHLLHDAKLLSVCWDKALRRFEINFQGLRSDDQGNTIDRPITLQLQDVVSIAAYRPIPRLLEGIKPDNKPVDLITAEELTAWESSGGQFSLHVNSRRNQIDFDTALVLVARLGEVRLGPGSEQTPAMARRMVDPRSPSRQITDADSRLVNSASLRGLEPSDTGSGCAVFARGQCGNCRIIPCRPLAQAPLTVLHLWCRRFCIACQID